VSGIGIGARGRSSRSLTHMASFRCRRCNRLSHAEAVALVGRTPLRHDGFQ
jgi:hypothetical protein